jgi:2-polyprenyl-3-methyl-5-hydroxy-6-metoxy-1,4-benzoquinol methylase
MLINMKIADKIPLPWFEPEQQSKGPSLGTDIQLCKRAREAGFSVWCDTSIVFGHVMEKREVVTPNNRHRIMLENKPAASVQTGISPQWKENSALQLYRLDAEEYLQMTYDQMATLANTYRDKQDRFKKYSDPRDYYTSLGPEQLCRQVWFHHLDFMIDQANAIWNSLNTNKEYYGLDFGCGSAPVSFELALRGHKVDFIDLDGAGAYEFTKWRAKKHGLNDRASFTWGGPYDYIMFLDSLEHLPNWQEILEKAISLLKENSLFITNYFFNNDFNNVEHISMNHEAVRMFLLDHHVYPYNDMVWVKRPIGGQP